MPPQSDSFYDAFIEPAILSSVSRGELPGLADDEARRAPSRRVRPLHNPTLRPYQSFPSADLNLLAAMAPGVTLDRVHRAVAEQLEAALHTTDPATIDPAFQRVMQRLRHMHDEDFAAMLADIEVAMWYEGCGGAVPRLRPRREKISLQGCHS